MLYRGDNMTVEKFQLRLSTLRIQKGVSAREMSLSLGLNSGYINNIECGKALPTMENFFLICEYLDITPKDFFDVENKSPNKISELLLDLQKLELEELENISALVKNLIK
jgi:transcriptional regulator with XRE-family HTH domain